MNALIEMLDSSKKFNSYIKDIENNIGPVYLTGLADVAKVYYICATKSKIKQRVLLITYNEIQAKKLMNDIKYFTDKVVFLPKKEVAAYDYLVESKDLPYERIDALNAICSNKVDIVVTTIEALMQPILKKEILFKNIIKLKVGESHEFEEIKKELLQMGYTRCDMIESKGQFTSRGGIIDIAISEKKGVRIEFWGDEVDSIRLFNISTQRSVEMLDKIEIYPAHEFLLDNSIDEVCEQIETKYEKYDDIIAKDIEIIRNGDYISKIDKYYDCFYKETTTLLEYFEDKYLFFIDEQTKIKARAKNIIIDNENIQKSLTEKEKIIPEALTDLIDFEQIEAVLNSKKRVYVEKQDIMQIAEERHNAININSREINYYKSSMEIFIEEVEKAINNKKTVIILGGSEDNSKKISLLMLDRDIPHKYVNKLDNEIENGIVIITTGVLSTGFEIADSNLIVVSSEELFNKDTKKRRKVHSAFNEGEKVVFADLKVGDYVVHKNHGIGQFIGVNTIKADKVIKDYIKIKYKNDDILYIPTNQLDTIRKYIGGGEAVPKLNKLGSKEWSVTKAKVKNNLREVAQNLIELYAKRQKAKGYAFSKDTAWQTQFENSFPYSETDDQLRCIEEVKHDMELDKPMDRLLCGDVGYGKTEVAIRAAFKAVMDHKQVVYLVPTTVLANQQYEGFKERMSEFAINVELLNRFRTKKEQNEVIKKLKLGEVDVVVGTHRLLSKDVEYKDLGLLIIDEEHRFGVKAKEKIKELKNSVDVLTMTATPIPRTLHMSIVGVRDMSVIYEPPQNRKPVQTYLLEYDEEIITEAITKELERGGQAFYLFNNVEGIERKAQQIESMVPEAKVVFAHGKMSGNELEEIMMRFVNNEANVLVCTTILESGIDIPNANTIIVENADRLGLAQLYQIRGRVGRGNTQSYAYVTYKPDKLLSEVADKRLKTIKEFTEFGSGFKIAMRDLEIRGAGSLLGEIQHGHMDQVGYDTYCKLLDEVVKEMQGEVTKEEIDVQIDINISCYIPDEYIENGSQKIEVYQNIALARNEGDINNVIDELIDRYGAMPEEVNNLIEIARIKELCKKARVTKVSQKRDSILFYFEKEALDMEVVNKLLTIYRNELKFSQGIEPYITYKVTQNGEAVIIKKVKDFLQNVIK